jgi:diguanylate cyclase (GGDEF)-like protein
MTAPVNLAELCQRLRLRCRPVASGPRVSPALDDALGLADELIEAERSDELLHRLCRRVARALELERCAFILTPPGTDAGRVVADETRAGPADLDLDLTRYPEITEARRTGEPVFVRDASRDPLFDLLRRGSPGGAGVALPRAVIAVPVRMDGDVAGVFLLRPGPATAPVPDDREGLAHTLGRVGASALRSHRNGHGNSRGGVASDAQLEGRVREEVERARRYSLGFSIVLLAVDDFAGFCSTHGRAAGDRVLAQVAGLLRESFRVPDLVAAHGGEEFALLLPETSAAHAAGAVRRFRSRMATEFFDGHEAGRGPTLAAGIAAFPHPSVTEPADLLALAAATLLRARTQEGERIAVTAV